MGKSQTRKIAPRSWTSSFVFPFSILAEAVISNCRYLMAIKAVIIRIIP
jgi:hypothetical protein